MAGTKCKTKNLFSLVVRDSIKLLTETNKKKRAEQLSETATPVRCSPPKVPTPSKKITADDLEEWNIKCLPSDWEPNVKPSRTIARLKEKKQKRHEEAVEEMEKKIACVNSNVEEKIRLVTVKYKDALANRNSAVKEVLKTIRTEYKGELQFTVEYFDELVNKIYDINRATKNRLYAMMDDLIDLEIERTDEFKLILKNAHEKLEAISHRLPFELQEFFEKKIQAINEITMNNMRCYVELKTQLRLHLKNKLRLDLEEIQSAKEHWIDFTKVAEFRKLNETKLLNIDCYEVLRKSDIVKGGEGRILTRSNDVNELYGKITTPRGISLDLVCKWLQDIDEIACDLDGFTKDLVEFFEETVVDVFVDYFINVDNLAKRVIALGYIEPFEYPQLKVELCSPMVLETSAKYTLHLQNIHTLWKDAQDDLLANIRDTFVFLYRLVMIRNDHLSRLKHVEVLVMKDLQRLQNQNDVLVCVEETKLNMALDALRQDVKEENLTESLRNIQSILAAIEKVYQVNCEKESKLLEKAADLIEIETAVLSAQLNQFLSVYSEFAPTNVSSEEPDVLDQADAPGHKPEELLTSQIGVCRDQIQNLKLWRNQLWVVVNNYSETCDKKNLEWAKYLIDTTKDNLETILRRKLGIVHKTKYDRIVASVYEIRLAELRSHKDRVQRHKAGADKQIEEAITIFPKYEVKYDSVLAKYHENILNLTNKTTIVNNAELIMSCQAVLKLLAEKCHNAVTTIDKEYQDEHHCKINAVSLATRNYAKAILMFSEDGNFNWQEAKSMCADLAKLGKTYKKKLATSSKACSSKLGKCIHEMEAERDQLQELMRGHFRELEFASKSRNILKDVQANLIKEAFDLKFKRKQLAAYIGDFEERIDQFAGVPCWLQTVSDLFYKIIERVEEFLTVISRPEANHFGNYVAKELSTVTLHNQKRTPSKTSDQKLGHGVYKNWLFDTRPPNGDDFISKTQHLVYTSFERILFSGAEFYANHPESHFHRENLMQPNYEDFVVEMLPKYIYYYLQCEIAWLGEAHEFIKMLEDLSRSFGKYCETFMLKYAADCVRELQEIHHDITNKIEAEKSCDKDKFFSIYGKLKPLHGYPGNKPMLDELKQEMKEFLESDDREYVEPFLQRKTELEHKKEIIKEELQAVNVELEVLEDVFVEKSFDRNLALQFEATVDYFATNILAQKLPSDETNTFKLRVVQELELLKANLAIPEEYQIEASWSSSGDEESKSSVDVANLLERYEVEIQEIFEEIDGIEKTKMANYQQWKDMWILDNEKVLKLYDVKYNLPK